MNFFTVVSCVVGIYFASSATSFHVKHDVGHEQRINRSMQEQETTDNTGEKMISEPVRIIERRQNTQIIGHSKFKLDEFPQEHLMNLDNKKSRNNSLPDQDGKQGQNDYINRYENEDKHEEDSNEDTAVIWISGDPEQKHNIQTYDSEDQQSGDGLTSAEDPELHENLEMELNIVSVKLDGDSSKEYLNIPEEMDEDLKYVLNSTLHDQNMNAELSNKTSKDHILQNTKGILSDSESEPNNNKDDNDNKESHDRAKIENNFLLYAKKGRNMTTLLNDIDFIQKEEVEEEETTHQSMESADSGGDVPEYHNNFRQKENITDQTLTTHSPENAEIGLNHSHVQEIDSALKKIIKIVETNKTKLPDSCSNFHCKRGKMCKTDGNGNPLCACQDPDLCQPTNLNDRVCGTDNKTYSSDCYLFATKCQLDGTKEGGHLHLDYQGPCKYIPPCTDYELANFPFRMRDWLKNVLIQLYEGCLENPDLLSEKQRNKVNKIYENEKRLQEGDHNIELLVKDFQKNYHMYVYPVHWQFSQLDQHSIDRLLTRSELSALRAPLIPMEHCVTAFLQGCNTNDDKHISLQEWCHCFGIKDGDIDENLLF
ncbi:SPARC-like protein 1 [Rana temporaria]|uniref:SPARC-like protein 1 n=1 Tax=Rana temporaria TaxID=8407 RepID=UPI001AAD090F|nr:SPARC-like protein 1 [Rana temporaria]